MCDQATAAKRPEGAPKYSDVCFTSRWMRPVNKKDPYESFSAGKSFHATRLEWFYPFDSYKDYTAEEIAVRKAFIEKAKALGWTVSGSIYGQVRNKAKTDQMKIDQKGRPHHPWGGSRGHGCVNNPAFVIDYRQWLERLIDVGVDSIQRDEPAEFTPCWCARCKAKAKEAGKDITSARANQSFQTTCLLDFYRRMHAEVDRYAGQHVLKTANMFSVGRAINQLREVFDSDMTEMAPNQALAKAFMQMNQDARKLGRFTIMTGTHVWTVSQYRTAISACYANGLHFLVPWDEFKPRHPRYFGKPEDFSDLYGFARANAALLDGYEPATHDLSVAVAAQRYGGEDAFRAAPVHLRHGDSFQGCWVRVWRQQRQRRGRCASAVHAQTGTELQRAGRAELREQIGPSRDHGVQS